MSAKLYIGVSGAAFAVLVVAHVARVIIEGTHPLGEPMFVGSTAAAIGMAGWAAFLLRRAL